MKKETYNYRALYVSPFSQWLLNYQIKGKALINLAWFKVGRTLKPEISWTNCEQTFIRPTNFKEGF